MSGTAEVATGDDEPDGDQASSPVSSLARESGISAGVVGLLVLLRIMAVSEWNWHTASTVAETIDVADIATIALGTLFEQQVLTGLAVVVLLPLTIVRVISAGHDRRHELMPLLVFILGQLILAVALVWSENQWWLPLGVVALTGVLLATRSLGRGGAGRRIVGEILQRLGIIAVAALLLLAALNPTPWVPHEEIRTSDGKTVEGYVLEDVSGTVKVLVPGEHQLVILTAGEVDSRTVSGD